VGVEDLLGLGRMMARQRDGGRKLAACLLHVRGRAGALQKLAANPAQRAFEQRRGQHNIVLKARQMGLTTWVAGRFFLKTITARGVLTVQVAQNQVAARSLFEIVQRMWENLPTELRNGPLRRSRASMDAMVFPELDSAFKVWSAADRNAGRGLSIQNLHCSEVSRWPGNAAETLAGLRAALTPDGEMVLESTPHGAHGAFYEEWVRAAESSSMVRHFLPWWMEPAYRDEAVAEEAMREDELALCSAHGLTAEQIGFRRRLEKNFGVLRAQEFAEDAESCFRASGDCCFDVSRLDALLDDAAEPVRKEENGLWVWLEPLPGRRYVVSADPAGGGAQGDFCGLQVVDEATGMQCAELQAKLPPREFARRAAAVARRYNDALLVVERNNHGAAVIAFLQTAERYAELYAEGGALGWLTTASSKEQMVSALGAALFERPEVFRSRRLLMECRSFVRGERGGTAAAAGTYDDLVIAMAIAQQVRTMRVRDAGNS
jgi:hypothetical protein